MPLDVGKRLGPYEIQEALGAGGMGEVYRARDTRLDRTVAIKVLPSHMSDHAELRQRFEREARTISNLNHPNICALYDIGSEDGIDFLVMEHLEGETLAERLRRAPLTLDETLRIAQEMSAALDRAHRSGVVHRDLKPGNIILTRAGAKLLDFGLAKIAGGGSDPVSGLTAMATERASDQPLTAEGTILGTFQYMAPEQLEGKDADARTDIFAFGTVVYEMATGSRAFSGKSQASLIASILKEQPRAISTVAPMTPPALDRLVRACMEKDPDDRIQTAHDVNLQLRWVVEGGSETGVPAPVKSRRRRREMIWMASTAVLAAALVTAVVFAFRHRPAPLPTVRLELTVPHDASYTIMAMPVLSPDGARLAFVGQRGNDMSLWVRDLGSEEPRRLAGTEDAHMPFWSPDGHMIGFFAEGRLKKVAADGGPPQVLCEASVGWGGSWGRRGILFSTGDEKDGILLVPDSGGQPRVITQVADDEELHAWPSFLPDGEHFLYMGDAEFAEGHYMKVGSLDGKTNKRLVNMISNVLFVAPDRVLFTRAGTLLAQRIDLDALELRGEPVPLASDLTGWSYGHFSEFSASATGLLAYRSASPLTVLAVYDRSGRRVRTVGEPGRFDQFDVSPDGRRIAVDVVDAESRRADVWLVDLATGAASRFTTDPGSDGFPAWSPDGRSVYFSSSRTGTWRAYEKSSSRIESPRILGDNTIGNVIDVSPDGKMFILDYWDVDGSTNFWTAGVDTGGGRVPLAQENLGDFRACFSPDGRWLAYDSDQSGRREVYIQSFPDPVTRIRVSSDGGNRPRWRADGRELYFEGPGAAVMAVGVDTRGELSAGTPRKVFDVPESFEDFAPLGDGDTFLVVVRALNRHAQPLTVVLNWDAMLGER